MELQNKHEKVLTTRMEHHANDLPWSNTATVEYVEVDKLIEINSRTK
jgi:selenocysteine lyase/cysteine desulfurase